MTDNNSFLGNKNIVYLSKVSYVYYKDNASTLFEAIVLFFLRKSTNDSFVFIVRVSPENLESLMGHLILFRLLKQPNMDC